MKIIKEYINEKFVEDSDPVHDLGIGLPTLWKNELKEMEELRYTLLAFEKKFKPYCKNQIYDKNQDTKKILAKVIYVVLDECLKDVNKTESNLKLFTRIFNDIANEHHMSKKEKQIMYRDCKKILLKKYGFEIEEELKEWLNEKFIEDSDPIHDLGIGMISKIKSFLKQYDVTNYRINKDGTISVYGNLNFDLQNIQELPEYITFKRVTGKFIGSYQMTSMRGFPRIIKGNFQCGSNSFKSLDYLPEYVGGNFYIGYKFNKDEIRKRCKIGGKIS